MAGRVCSTLVLPVSSLQPTMSRSKRTPQKSQESTPKAPSKRPRSPHKNARPSKVQKTKNAEGKVPSINEEYVKPLRPLSFSGSDSKGVFERELMILQDADAFDNLDDERRGTEQEGKSNSGNWRKKFAAFENAVAEMKVVKNQVNNLPEFATPTKIAVRDIASPEKTTASSPLCSFSSLPTSPDKQMARFVQFKFSDLGLNRWPIASDCKAIFDSIKRLEEQMETVIQSQIKISDDFQNVKDVVEGMLDDVDGQENVVGTLKDRIDFMEERVMALAKEIAWKKSDLPVTDASACGHVTAAEREITLKDVTPRTPRPIASRNNTTIEKGSLTEGRCCE